MTSPNSFAYKIEKFSQQFPASAFNEVIKNASHIGVTGFQMFVKFPDGSCLTINLNDIEFVLPD